MNFVRQVGVRLGEAPPGVGLHALEDLLGVCQKFLNGVGIGGVEGQGDHRLHLVQLNGNVLVIPGNLSRVQGLIVPGAAMGTEEALRHLVRLPDGGEAGGLGGHHINAVAVVNGQVPDARAAELQHAVIYKPRLKGGLHQGDGHIVGAHALFGHSGEIHQHHLGHGHIPGVFQQLLGKLRAALAHGHGAQGAVAGVGVGAQDHLAAPGQLLPGVGVDDALIGGYIDAAVLLGGGQAEHMVILVDGAAHGTQTVVAVGQGVGEGKFLHAGGSRLLDDAHIGDVVGHHGVKAHLQPLRIAAYIVGLQDLPGHGVLPGPGGGHGGCFRQLAVFQENALIKALDHTISSLRKTNSKYYTTLLTVTQ